MFASIHIFEADPQGGDTGRHWAGDWILKALPALGGVSVLIKGRETPHTFGHADDTVSYQLRNSKWALTTLGTLFTDILILMTVPDTFLSFGGYLVYGL